jgi:hypothetical protein
LLTANNSDEAAISIINEPNSNIGDEIGRIVEDSALVSRPTDLNNPTPTNNNDSGPITLLCQHQQASSPITAAAEKEKEPSNKTASLPPSRIIGLLQITSDDAAPVPLSQQIAAINDEKSDYKSRIGLEQITCDDTAPVGPIQQTAPTNHQNSVGDTEPTTASTRSDAPFENATNNGRNNLLRDEESRNEHGLIEAYLVEEDEEISIYDATPATPELPWWRQRRTKVFILVICILLSLLAALLAFFLGATPPPTTSLSPSSSPHTSPKVSLAVVSNDITITAL